MATLLANAALAAPAARGVQARGKRANATSFGSAGRVRQSVAALAAPRGANGRVCARSAVVVKASETKDVPAVVAEAAPASTWEALKAKRAPLTAAALCATAVLLGGAAPANAVTGPVAQLAAAAAINGADTAWILVSSALVLFMSIPGLALFYAGLVREKNALQTLSMCFVLVATITVLWTVCGYSLSFAAGSDFIGGLSKAFLNGVTSSSVVQTIPEALWFIFQGTFAIITPGLMVGAFVERLKFSSFLLFTTLWSLLVYCPICHQVWGGGFLAQMGVLDFAGGIVVHITAGIGALLACIMLGPRKQNKMTPHNLPMAVTGAGMLWVGWYGFNGGSAVAAGATAAMAIVVSQISAATAALTWMALDWKENKPTTLGLITGSIAGLAAITPAAGFVGVNGGFCIGFASAIICRYFSTAIKSKFGFDDSLDVFGVHGVGGFVGTLLLSVFATTAFGGNQAITVAALAKVQFLAAGYTTVYTLAVTWAILKLTDATLGLRASSLEEDKGMDATDFGEEAYLEAF